MRASRPGVLAAAALIAACSLAPSYHVPETPAPPAFKEADGWQTAQPADSTPRGEWWKAFGDPQLDTLESALANANQDLKAAVARYAQASAEARAARASLLPAIGANASVRRSRISAHAPQNSSGHPIYSNDFVAGGDFAFEIDVFGRLRNAAQSAAAQRDAAAGDLATLNLSLQAELAQDYFSLRAADAALQLFDGTLAAYAKALELTRNRHAGGIASEVDVDQAQTQLDTAQSEATEVRLQRATLEHALAVLTGAAPADLKLPVGTLGTVPPPVGAGLPSTLLQRRPDIAAAERRVAAANAGIGVARAAFFPVFSLGATGGAESSRAPNWLSAPNLFWSLGPSALMTVFDSGRRSALSDEARAAYDASVAEYRQQVLGAYREVEDAIAAIRLLEDETRSQDSAAAAAALASEQAEHRYRGGLASYLEVVSAQSVLLAAQRASIELRARRLSAHVLLVKALGGGWSPDAPLPVAGGG